MEYTLKWEGPYKFFNNNKYILDHEIIREKGGIYLWTIQKTGGNIFFPIYIGKANYFWDRIIEHMRYYFSGNYVLYDMDKLHKNLNKDVLYSADKNVFNKVFMTEFDKYSKMAYENMQGYNLFFAEVNDIDKQNLTIIESEIISKVRDSKYGELLDNSRLSIRYEGKVAIQHIIPDDISIAGLSE